MHYSQPLRLLGGNWLAIGIHGSRAALLDVRRPIVGENIAKKGKAWADNSGPSGGCIWPPWPRAGRSGPSARCRGRERARPALRGLGAIVDRCDGARDVFPQL